MTKLSVRVPNFKPNQPNVNGHIIPKDIYIDALERGIKRGLFVCFGEPEYPDIVTQVIPKLTGAKVIGYSYEDNEAGLILDIEVFHTPPGERLAMALGYSNHLFAGAVAKFGSFDKSNTVMELDIGRYYWEGQMDTDSEHLKIDDITS